MSFYEAAALEVVLQAKVADVLVDHPKGLPIAKLSELTGVNSDKLGRILRLLATQHCFVEGSISSSVMKKYLVFTSADICSISRRLCQ